jgi:hypothetical protein
MQKKKRFPVLLRVRTAYELLCCKPWCSYPLHIVHLSTRHLALLAECPTPPPHMAATHYTIEDERVRALEAGAGCEDWESSDDEGDGAYDDEQWLCSESDGAPSGVDSEADDGVMVFAGNPRVRSLLGRVPAVVKNLWTCCVAPASHPSRRLSG